MRTKPSQQKRARERARQEKREQKVAKREAAKLRRAQAGPRPQEDDPDIAGIVPGPQPSPWEEE